MTITVVYNFSPQVLEYLNKSNYTLSVTTKVIDPEWTVIEIDGQQVTTNTNFLDDTVRFDKDKLLDETNSYFISRDNITNNTLSIQVTGFLCNETGDIIYMSTPVVRSSHRDKDETIQLMWVLMYDFIDKDMGISD